MYTAGKRIAAAEEGGTVNRDWTVHITVDLARVKYCPSWLLRI